MATRADAVLLLLEPPRCLAMACDMDATRYPTRPQPVHRRFPESISGFSLSPHHTPDPVYRIRRDDESSSVGADSAWLLVLSCPVGLAAGRVGLPRAAALRRSSARRPAVRSPTSPTPLVRAYTRGGLIGLDPTSCLRAGEGHLLRFSPTLDAAPILGATDPCEVRSIFQHRTRLAGAPVRCPIRRSMDAHRRARHEVDKASGDGAGMTSLSIPVLSATWSRGMDTDRRRKNARGRSIARRCSRALVRALAPLLASRWYPANLCRGAYRVLWPAAAAAGSYRASRRLCARDGASVQPTASRHSLLAMMPNFSFVSIAAPRFARRLLSPRVRISMHRPPRRSLPSVTLPHSLPTTNWAPTATPPAVVAPSTSAAEAALGWVFPLLRCSPRQAHGR